MAMNILIHYPFDAEQIETFRRLARELGDHQVHHADSDEEALACAPDVEILLGRFSPPMCAAAPQLRWIQSFSAGMDSFLFPEIVERDDVVITNMAGLYADQGAEQAWALLLALTRGIDLSVRGQDQRKWTGGRGTVLTGSTLGIIGLGGFGMNIARRALGYDMTILALDPVRQDKPDEIAELKPATRENLHDLLRRSDVVMIACPKTAETYHLIGTEELAAMKNSAYLINVTRGGIIDEPALIEALENNEIAGAGLDVCEQEPLPPENPLWDAPNLILSAHHAGSSQHRPRMVFEFFRDNLERYLKGEELVNIIGKKRGY
jgi:D-2-hydroxyacid dehydrogenase (NADP+)